MITRRKLLGNGLSAFSLSTLLNLNLMSRAFADNEANISGKKGLICLYFPGGVDSYNVLLPSPFTAATKFQAYSDRRGPLALKNDEVLPSSVPLGAAPHFTLHKSLPKLAESFNANNGRQVAFISGVGPLAERSSGKKIKTNGGRMPAALQSHSDQTVQWQTAVPDASEFAGWAGRVGELINAMPREANAPPPAEMYTLDGSQVFVNGRSTAPLFAAGLFSLDPLRSADTGDWPTGIPVRNAVRGHSGYSSWETQLRLRILQGAGSEGVLDPFTETNTYYSLLQQTAARRIESSMRNGNWFKDNLRLGWHDGLDGTLIPTTPLEERIYLALQIIKARLDHTPANRVIVFVATPMGWDHHADMKNLLGKQLTAVDNAIEKFFQWTEVANNHLAEKVVLFSASEFGRTLTINPSVGSDHAWSGVQFVCGKNSGVNTGCYGIHPWGPTPTGSPNSLLTDEGQLNYDNDGYNRGILSPVIAVDDYYRDIGRWFGVQPNGLELVLPNLYNTGPLSGSQCAILNSSNQIQMVTPFSAGTTPMIGASGSIGFINPQA